MYLDDHSGGHLDTVKSAIALDWESQSVLKGQEEITIDEKQREGYQEISWRIPGWAEIPTCRGNWERVS